MTNQIRLGACAALTAALLLPAVAGAQTVAERAARFQTGILRLSFASRSEVCGGGGNGNVIIRRGSGSTSVNQGAGVRRDEWEADECEPGPVRVALSVERGRILSLRTYVAGRWRPAGDTVLDLGTVPVREAVDYLLGIAERGTGKASSNAIFAVTLADSVVVWPRLMRIARDEERPRETRRQAVFWLGQAAGDAATAGLDTLARDDGLNRDVREHAVFALSQRPREEGIPALLRIARTSRDPEIRRKAIFWLGQSDDPRALALFEELLGVK